MSTAIAEYSTVHRLAKKLERDIQFKSLSPGDRYLTAAEAAHMLGVSRTLANRAMLLLANQNLLIRRRGQGTSIGPAMQVDSAVGKLPRNKSLQSILLLEATEGADIRQTNLDAMLSLLRRRFDQALVHHLYLPQHHTVEYVRQFVECSKQAGACVGVIALSCIHSVYAYLAECGVPTVVVGTLYPDQRQALPSIDLDNHEAGLLLTRALAARGHQRFAVMLGVEGRAGTEHFLNGVLAGMHATGLSPANLVARFYPGSKEAFVAQAKDLLSIPNRPNAVIVQGDTVARWLNTIAADLGLSIPGQLEIGYVSKLAANAEPSFGPCVYPQEPYDHIAARVVEMLWRRSQNIPLEENNVLVPVSVSAAGCSRQEHQCEEETEKQATSLPMPTKLCG